MVIEGGFTVVARWDRLVGLSFNILHKFSIEIILSGEKNFYFYLSRVMRKSS